MSVYPFIEAEKVEDRNVTKACELMEVSRSAFYDWVQRQPSRREVSDAEFGERIEKIHAKSRGPRMTAVDQRSQIIGLDHTGQTQLFGQPARPHTGSFARPQVVVLHPSRDLVQHILGVGQLGQPQHRRSPRQHTLGATHHSHHLINGAPTTPFCRPIRPRTTTDRKKSAQPGSTHPSAAHSG